MPPVFETLFRSGHARRGRLHLAHGTVETPVFMPVGTYGAVKGIDPTELEALGTQILLSNTYHLYLRPGPERLRAFGGLHRFMGWSRPILTDSGGFQVFSLSGFRQLDEDGVTFRSQLDGAVVRWTPEVVAATEAAIGSDIAMVLDECPSLPADTATLRKAVERSARWAERFLACPRPEGQRVFGIVQGGTDAALRLESLERTAALVARGMDGLAIGGLSVGEPHDERIATLDVLAPHLPDALPHYLMGVGTPLDLLEAVRRGIDLFDCVLPTRNGRNGGLFTEHGLVNIRNARFKDQQDPVDRNCRCSTCTRYSAAYLRHLFHIGEMLGCRLATIHNLHYYHDLMAATRRALEAGRFEAFYEEKRQLLRAAYGPDSARPTTPGAETS
jgi:queuine tRNA-ribosyltransferase